MLETVLVLISRLIDANQDVFSLVSTDRAVSHCRLAEGLQEGSIHSILTSLWVAFSLSP
jgi:hypothetical protein